MRGGRKRERLKTSGSEDKGSGLPRKQKTELNDCSPSKAHPSFGLRARFWGGLERCPASDLNFGFAELANVWFLPSALKGGGGPPHSKALRAFRSRVSCAPAPWSAAVLCRLRRRFGFAPNLFVKLTRMRSVGAAMVPYYHPQVRSAEEPTENLPLMVRMVRRSYTERCREQILA